MSRRKTDPSVEWKLYIPLSLAAKIELLLLDPTRQKVRFGARSQLIASLLAQWVRKQEQQP